MCNTIFLYLFELCCGFNFAKKLKRDLKHVFKINLDNIHLELLLK